MSDAESQQPVSAVAELRAANLNKLQFQRAVLERLLDAGMECEIAFDAVTSLAVPLDSDANECAEYALSIWQAAMEMTKALLQRTSDSHKIPHLAIMVFMRTIR